MNILKSFNSHGLYIAIVLGIIGVAGANIFASSVAEANPSDQCNAIFTYEKTADFDDSRLNINFSNGDTTISVSAKSGYQITEVSLNVENDGHSGYFQYASGPLTNFNPSPGNDINEVKVKVKRVCAASPSPSPTPSPSPSVSPSPSPSASPLPTPSPSSSSTPSPSSTPSSSPTPSVSPSPSPSSQGGTPTPTPIPTPTPQSRGGNDDGGSDDSGDQGPGGDCCAHDDDKHPDNQSVSKAVGGGEILGAATTSNPTLRVPATGASSLINLLLASVGTAVVVLGNKFRS